MSIVTLVSGGLDSTLVARLAQEQGVRQHPLFIDYGQRARDRELAACRASMRSLGLDTDTSLRVFEDAFTPGRNMLFLLTAAAHAYQHNADAISIGLLHEDTSLFPDQTSAFLSEAEALITRSMGRTIRVLAPLAQFHKHDVVTLAEQKGIHGTYSCHLGGEEPCGACIACNEFKFEEA